MSASVGPRFADGLAAVQMLGSPVPAADVSRCSKLRVQKLNLFDHLVGEAEQIWRYLDAERFAGLEIDHPPPRVALVPASSIGVTLHEELF